MDASKMSSLAFGERLLVTAGRSVSPSSGRQSPAPSLSDQRSATSVGADNYSSSTITTAITSPAAGSQQRKLPKVFKTEYKAKFKPFDQYVYNETTDCFVRTANDSFDAQDTCEIVSQATSCQNHAAVTRAKHPVDEFETFADSASVCRAGGGEVDAPWYREVIKRNEKAQEYRFKSESGHTPTFSAAPNCVVANDVLTGVMPPVSVSLLTTVGDDCISVSSVRGGGTGDDTQQQQQQHDSGASLTPAYSFSPRGYQKRDDLIARMAKNNNFALASPKAASAKTSATMQRSAPAPRARSQSSRRLPQASTTRSQPQAPTTHLATPTRRPTTTATASRLATTSSVQKVASATKPAKSSTAPTAPRPTNSKPQPEQTTRTRTSTSVTPKPKPNPTATSSSSSSSSAATPRPNTTATKTVPTAPAAKPRSRPSPPTPLTTTKTTTAAATSSRTPTATTIRQHPVASVSSRTSTNTTTRPPLKPSATQRLMSQQPAALQARSARPTTAGKQTPQPPAAEKSIKTPKALAAEAAAAAAAASVVASSTPASIVSKTSATTIKPAEDPLDNAPSSSSLSPSVSEQDKLSNKQEEEDAAAAAHIVDTKKDISDANESVISNNNARKSMDGGNTITEVTQAGNMLSDELAAAETAAAAGGDEKRMSIGSGDNELQRSRLQHDNILEHTNKQHKNDEEALFSDANVGKDNAVNENDDFVVVNGLRGGLVSVELEGGQEEDVDSSGNIQRIDDAWSRRTSADAEKPTQANDGLSMSESQHSLESNDDKTSQQQSHLVTEELLSLLAEQSGGEQVQAREEEDIKLPEHDDHNKDDEKLNVSEFIYKNNQDKEKVEQEERYDTFDKIDDNGSGHYERKSSDEEKKVTNDHNDDVADDDKDSAKTKNENNSGQQESIEESSNKNGASSPLSLDKSYVNETVKQQADLATGFEVMPNKDEQHDIEDAQKEAEDEKYNHNTDNVGQWPSDDGFASRDKQPQLAADKDLTDFTRDEPQVKKAEEDGSAEAIAVEDELETAKTTSDQDRDYEEFEILDSQELRESAPDSVVEQSTGVKQANVSNLSIDDHHPQHSEQNSADNNEFDNNKFCRDQNDADQTKDIPRDELQDLSSQANPLIQTFQPIVSTVQSPLSNNPLDDNNDDNLKLISSADEIGKLSSADGELLISVEQLIDAEAKRQAASASESPRVSSRAADELLLAPEQLEKQQELHLMDNTETNDEREEYEESINDEVKSKEIETLGKKITDSEGALETQDLTGDIETANGRIDDAAGAASDQQEKTAKDAGNDTKKATVAADELIDDVDDDDEAVLSSKLTNSDDEQILSSRNYNYAARDKPTVRYNEGAHARHLQQDGDGDGDADSNDLCVDSSGGSAALDTAVMTPPIKSGGDLIGGVSCVGAVNNGIANAVVDDDEDEVPIVQKQTAADCVQEIPDSHDTSGIGNNEPLLEFDSLPAAVNDSTGASKTTKPNNNSSISRITTTTTTNNNNDVANVDLLD